MTINTNSIFFRLKRYKYKHLLTWVEMAKRLGISYWTLMRVQQAKGKKFNFSMKTIEKIRTFFKENK
jgi:DNA-binding XRE family transcriptional regulator